MAMAHLFLGSYRRRIGSSPFAELIRNVSEAKTKYEEEQIVLQEREKLIDSFKSVDSTKKMKDILLRLVYCHIFSLDVSFCHIYAVNFLQKGKTINEKKIGYLAVSLFMHREHELLLLLINSLQKDLDSTSLLEVCLALNLICCIPSSELIVSLLPYIKKNTAHENPQVRKKAILALLCGFKVIPHIVAPS
eukprot:Sdes_comp17665_c2_seq1m6933